MTTRAYITANEAVARAVVLARAEVVAAYPITPQTTIVEKLASFIEGGQLAAEYMKVESEHSAMAACIGACSVGARAFTATSSQGLEYMHEMLAYASGGRLPIVMANVNRSVALPWSIWGDHQDSIQQRDTGWIQVYLETAQESLDMLLQAYRIAEDPRVSAPIMLCLDAFILSHTEEMVEVPDQAQADAFVPPFKPLVCLDVEKPMTLGMGAFGKSYATWRKEQQEAMERAKAVIVEVGNEFARVFGRCHGGLVEAYRCEGAEAVFVAMGAACGTARDVVDAMRDEGKLVGLLKVRAYRPFPRAELRAALRGARAVAVMDRDVSFGHAGALASDVRSALYGMRDAPATLDFVAGLGGSDVTPEHIRYLLEKALAAQRGAEPSMEFIDT